MALLMAVASLVVMIVPTPASVRSDLQHEGLIGKVKEVRTYRLAEVTGRPQKSVSSVSRYSPTGLRLDTKHYSDGKPYWCVEWTYAATGDRTETQRRAPSTWVYGGSGPGGPVPKTDSEGWHVESMISRLTYDRAGRLVAEQVIDADSQYAPVGRRIVYSHYPNGRLKTETIYFAGETSPRIQEVHTYNAKGELTRSEYTFEGKLQNVSTYDRHRYDRQGNWIERHVLDDGSENEVRESYTETRDIDYY